EDVHAVQPQAVEGLGVRAPHPGLGEVPFAHVVVRDGEAVGAVVPGAATGSQHPPHLGGDQVLLARVAGQALPETAFAGADPVVRGGVEVADPGVPGRGDRPVGLLVGGDAVEVPQ